MGCETLFVHYVQIYDERVLSKSSQSVMLINAIESSKMRSQELMTVLAYAVSGNKLNNNKTVRKTVESREKLLKLNARN